MTESLGTETALFALVGLGFIAVGAVVYFLLFRGTKAPLAA